MSFMPVSSHLSINEQMIPFHGKTSLRQYVKNKSNPVGLKNFVLTTSNGLVLGFFIYQGASTWPSGQPEPDLGLGGSVVKKLVEGRVLREHVVYFDRYFRSITPLQYLMERKIYAVGTISVSHIPSALKSKFTADKELMETGRGSFDEFITEDGKISVLKWIDNRSVTVASTFSGASPTNVVKRWDRKAKEFIEVPQLKCMSNYNKSVGGVNLCDRMVSYYQISKCTKKWSLRVFFHFIDMAIVHS
ncbi:piggyBac transposable element-derived protein 3-like [Schistocerca piceifrons]|uniref:piggyBac transposable element-derived protein 3-like n=1 Tax=Schistocerca piceifrons TaxID=274613 RepID=UPI001F5F180D|nr:piggyBac transposable element-derived protein 3-like [Schistocerca piceifrons]